MHSEAAENGDKRKRVTPLGSARGRKLEQGQVVQSVRGRDRNRWYVVIDQDKEGFLYVADGERRPLARPKRKNPKHLLVYDRVIAEIQVTPDGGPKGADAELRQALQEVADSFNHNGEEDDDTGQARRD